MNITDLWNKFPASRPLLKESKTGVFMETTVLDSINYLQINNWTRIDPIDDNKIKSSHQQQNQEMGRNNDDVLSNSTSSHDYVLSFDSTITTNPVNNSAAKLEALKRNDNIIY